jgi:hypothetical protein
MTATDKWPLISESVASTRIDIHQAGEEPDQHVVRVAPGVSRTTIVRKVPTKSKSGLALRMKSRLLVMLDATVILVYFILLPTNRLEEGRSSSTK